MSKDQEITLQLLKIVLEKVERLDDKIDETKNETNFRLDKIDENLGKHMRRTEIAEIRLNALESNVDELQTEVKPITERFEQFKGMAKLAAWIGSGIVAVIGILWELFKK